MCVWGGPAGQWPVSKSLDPQRARADSVVSVTVEQKTPLWVVIFFI